MKKINLRLLVLVTLVLSLFCIFISTFFYFENKVNVIEGKTSSIYDIYKDIKIKKFPSGKYKYIFDKNALTQEFSLELYGNIKHDDIKKFCVANFYTLRSITLDGRRSIRVPKTLCKEQDLYLTKFYEITGKSPPLNIKMYVSRIDGRFYAKITHFLRD